MLTETLAELKRGDVAVARPEVTTAEEASRLNFPGSPAFQAGRRGLFRGRFSQRNGLATRTPP